MTIKISTIMYSQRVKLLNSQEDHFRDFKSKKITPAKITKSISAFANADGGDLYIGIEEDKNNKIKLWRGFENVEEANGFIQIFEKLFPLGQEFSYEFLIEKKINQLIINVKWCVLKHYIPKKLITKITFNSLVHL